MSENKENLVFVIGHKNPDTDSICSAIAFADLKNRIRSQKEIEDHVRYVPRRAGHVNSETSFVLKTFGLQPPEYIMNVGTQVRDMSIRKSPKVDRLCSLKKAWEIMSEHSLVTLPVRREDDTLDGLITIGDIARTYIKSSSDSSILSSAKVLFGMIAETIGGTIVTGDPQKRLAEGKILIGAADPDKIVSSVEEGDLVIIASSEKPVAEIIQKGASCIIMALDIPVHEDEIKAAEKSGCVIISTDSDTYTIARQIIQSIPIEHIMRTKKLLTFSEEDYTENIQSTLIRNKHRAFPVLDVHDKCIGTISRRNFLGIKKKKVILVDHNDLGQAVDNIETAEILEIVDHHRLGDVQTSQPIHFRNEPVGCTATIIFRIYQEERIDPSPEIAGILCAAILSDTLMFRSPTCTIQDKMAAGSLAAISGKDMYQFAKDMFMAGSDLEHKSPEAIFYQDFKQFNVDRITFGVGQISSMAPESLAFVKEKIRTFMESQCGHNGVSHIFFMLTDILSESTELLFCGEDAQRVVEIAFKTEVHDGSCTLPGVVSRKKQLVPRLVSAIQEL
ncbi:MAG: putative manganese-dependent inorganic diphosphatase [Eubacterium sp.]|nr:putative manganese-dependent inorganic diphosphatase [Eubacterium sp.]